MGPATDEDRVAAGRVPCPAIHGSGPTSQRWRETIHTRSLLTPYNQDSEGEEKLTALEVTSAIQMLKVNPLALMFKFRTEMVKVCQEVLKFSLGTLGVISLMESKEMSLRPDNIILLKALIYALGSNLERE